MGSKTGVYICEGCGIGQSVDVQALAGAAAAFGVAGVKTGRAFCLEDLATIRQDVVEQEWDGVVIAACSPRVNRDRFRFEAEGGAPVHVQRVNLREQVAWSQPAGAEATQQMAEDLLKMGMAAETAVRPPRPFTKAHEETVLVVGGGPAGMSCAVSAADAGYSVVLVEKEAELGGFARFLHRQYPTRPPYHDLEPLALEQWIGELAAHPRIQVRTQARLAGIGGQPGEFVAIIESGGERQEMTVGSVVMATGFRLAGPDQLAHYGLGRLADVVTSLDLERMSAEGRIRRPSNQEEPQRVAIVACDRSADRDYAPYAGNVTSMVSLKQALYVRAAYPEAQVFVVYEDMQAPGHHELFYRHLQEDPGIFFVRGQVETVEASDHGAVKLMVGETVLGGPMTVTADLVVLAAGMIPASTADGEEPPLSLQYLQGGDLPTRPFGFADSHFLCFPYETRRTGIYTAGVVHRALDLQQSRRDGAAAAAKAVQVVEQSAQGAAVHPRVGDLGYPEFFMQKCTACGRCTQECPFGALELDAAHHPVINPNRCRRCGICMGACPVQIISFPDYSVHALSEMAKQVSMPEDDEDQLRILVFACENDAYPAMDMVGFNHLAYPATMRVVPVRCLGAVNSITVSDAIANGYDGVALLGCKAGDDYQCHFIQGSELLGRRMTNVRETLDRLALESERVQVLETTIADARRLPEVLQQFADGIAAVGPNPMKGF